MPDSNTQQEVPTLVRYRTLTDRLDAIDTKIVNAAFDIDALAAAGALAGVDLVAVSQSATEKKATLAAVWRQDSATGGTIAAIDPTAMVAGFAYSDGQIQASDSGFARGVAQDAGSTINASSGAFVSGLASGGGTLGSSGHMVVGQAVGAGSSLYADGGVAFGTATSGGYISAVYSGAFANGSAAVGYIQASLGAHASGYAGNGASIAADGSVSFAHGFALNGAITASGVGGFATGYAVSGGDILASGLGAHAFGYVKSAGAVQATAKGSFAQGYASATSIVASAINSVQFGPGTNAQADSLAVGTTVRLKGTTGAPATPRNGDIWVANNYMYLRTNGVSRKIV